MDLETDNHGPLWGRVGLPGRETTASLRPWPQAITGIALHVPGVRQGTNPSPYFRAPGKA